MFCQSWPMYTTLNSQDTFRGDSIVGACALLRTQSRKNASYFSALLQCRTHFYHEGQKFFFNTGKVGSTSTATGSSLSEYLDSVAEAPWIFRLNLTFYYFYFLLSTVLFASSSTDENAEQPPLSHGVLEYWIICRPNLKLTFQNPEKIFRVRLIQKFVGALLTLRTQIFQNCTCTLAHFSTKTNACTNYGWQGSVNLVFQLGLDLENALDLNVYTIDVKNGTQASHNPIDRINHFFSNLIHDMYNCSGPAPETFGDHGYWWVRYRLQATGWSFFLSFHQLHVLLLRLYYGSRYKSELPPTFNKTQGF